MEEKVSILKETRPGEKRVVLQPASIKQFIKEGYQVFVEHHAGIGSGFSDSEYEQYGAEILKTEDAWAKSSFVLKYKAPGEHEYKFFRPDLHLAAYFHAEGDVTLTKELCRKKVNAYSFEFFETSSGKFPLSVSDSEISGKLAVLYGAFHLQSHLGGCGMLLAHIPRVKPPKVVIIGNGNAGGAAARMASSLGAEVVVIGKNIDNIRKFEATVPPDIKCYTNCKEVLEREIPNADLVIGTILISTYDTPAMIDRVMLRKMKTRSIIIDITCGYGKGYLPTFPRLTSHSEPMCEVEGVLHCKIDALPASVPVTATQAFSQNVTPYLIALGNSIYEKNRMDYISNKGKIIENGKIVHPEILKNFRLLRGAS